MKRCCGKVKMKYPTRYRSGVAQPLLTRTHPNGQFYSNESITQLQQNPRPWLPRLPPAHGPPLSYDMYRGRWNPHPQSSCHNRNRTPYRRRRSHLDDIYHPNYEEEDGFQEASRRVYYKSRQGQDRPPSVTRAVRFQRTEDMTRPSCKAGRDTSSEIESNTSKHDQDIPKIEQCSENKLSDVKVNDIKTEPVCVKIEETEGLSISESAMAVESQCANNSARTEEQSSGILSKVNTSETITQPTQSTSVTKTNSDTSCNETSHSLRELGLENKSSSSVEVTTINDLDNECKMFYALRTNANSVQEKTDAVPANNKTASKVQEISAVLNVVDTDKRGSKDCGTVARTISADSVKHEQDTSAADNSSLLSDPYAVISSWPQQKKQVKVVHVSEREIDSDEETICYDEVNSPNMMDDYTVVDMDMGTPSPAKRKSDGNDVSVAKKPKYDDNFYSGINCEKLLSVVNKMVKEDKMNTKRSLEKDFVRYRSKSLDLKLGTEKTTALNKSKSLDSVNRVDQQITDILLVLSSHGNLKCNNSLSSQSAIDAIDCQTVPKDDSKVPTKCESSKRTKSGDEVKPAHKKNNKSSRSKVSKKKVSHKEVNTKDQRQKNKTEKVHEKSRSEEKHEPPGDCTKLSIATDEVKQNTLEPKAKKPCPPSSHNAYSDGNELYLQKMNTLFSKLFGVDNESPTEEDKKNGGSKKKNSETDDKSKPQQVKANLESNKSSHTDENVDTKKPSSKVAKKEIKPTESGQHKKRVEHKQDNSVKSDLDKDRKLASKRRHSTPILSIESSKLSKSVEEKEAKHRKVEKESCRRRDSLPETKSLKPTEENKMAKSEKQKSKSAKEKESKTYPKQRAPQEDSMLETHEANSCKQSHSSSLKVKLNIKTATEEQLMQFDNVKCSALYQTYPAMQRVDRMTKALSECIEEARAMERPDVTDKTEIIKPIIHTKVDVNDTSDDVIEIQKTIPIIDLTEDGSDTNSDESFDESDLRKNLIELQKAKEDVTAASLVEGDTITLYRSEETLNNSLDVQATVASISPSAVLRKTPPIVTKVLPSLISPSEQLQTPVSEKKKSCPNVTVSAVDVHVSASNTNGDRIEDLINKAIGAAQAYKLGNEQSTCVSDRTEVSNPPRITFQETLMTQTKVPQASILKDALQTAQMQQSKPSSSNPPTEKSNLMYSQFNATDESQSTGIPTSSPPIDKMSSVPATSKKIFSSFASPPDYESAIQKLSILSKKNFRDTPANTQCPLQPPVNIPTQVIRTDRAVVSSQNSNSTSCQNIITSGRSRLEADGNLSSMVNTVPPKRPEVNLNPNDTLNLNDPQYMNLKVKEISSLLIQYLLIYNNTKKAEMAFIRQLEQLNYVLPIVVKEETYCFKVQRSERFRELSKKLLMALRYINIGEALCYDKIQEIVMLVFNKLKHDIENLTTSWTILMLFTLMQPEEANYRLTPFLNSLYLYVSQAKSYVLSKTRQQPIANPFSQQSHHATTQQQPSQSLHRQQLVENIQQKQAALNLCQQQPVTNPPVQNSSRPQLLQLLQRQKSLENSRQEQPVSCHPHAVQSLIRQQSVGALRQDQPVQNPCYQQPIQNLNRQHSLGNSRQEQQIQNPYQHQPVKKIHRQLSVGNSRQEQSVQNPHQQQLVQNLYRQQSVENSRQEQSALNLCQQQSVLNLCQQQLVQSSPRRESDENPSQLSGQDSSATESQEYLTLTQRKLLERQIVQYWSICIAQKKILDLQQRPGRKGLPTQDKGIVVGNETVPARVEDENSHASSVPEENLRLQIIKNATGPTPVQNTPKATGERRLSAISPTAGDNSITLSYQDSSGTFVNLMKIPVQNGSGGTCRQVQISTPNPAETVHTNTTTDSNSNSASGCAKDSSDGNMYNFKIRLPFTKPYDAPRPNNLISVQAPITQNQTLLASNQNSVRASEIGAAVSAVPGNREPLLGHADGTNAELTAPLQSEEEKYQADSESVKVETEEQTIETIDLTWLDDIDPQQLHDEVKYSAMKKEEFEEKLEEEVLYNQEEELRVAASPTDSGIGSPPVPTEYSELVYTDRICICGKAAEYICVCRMVMYCSVPCQVKDWKIHRDTCVKQNTKSKEQN